MSQKALHQAKSVLYTEQWDLPSLNLLIGTLLTESVGRIVVSKAQGNFTSNAKDAT